MVRLGMQPARGAAFWLVGRIGRNEYVDREMAGMIFIAWRCLYAEVVGARMDDARLNLKRTYARFVGLVISRLQAHGVRWYQWHSRIRLIQPSKRKIVQKRYQKRKLMTTKPNAEFAINNILLTEYDRIKTDR